MSLFSVFCSSIKQTDDKFDLFGVGSKLNNLLEVTASQAKYKLWRKNKMFVLVSKYLIPKGFGGIAIFPFVILRTRQHAHDQVYLNHEKIHIRQQVELLVLPFFLWYSIEYLIRLIRYRDKAVAYRNISFEREAYANEKNRDYLKTR